MLILLHLIILITGSYFAIDAFGFYDFYNASIGEFFSILASVGLCLGTIIVMHFIAFLIIVILFFLSTPIVGKVCKPNTWFVHKAVYHLMSYFAFIFRLKISVRNRSNIPAADETFVIYANHQSQVDILCVAKGMHGRKFAYLSKPGIFKWPFIKDWMKVMGCIAINNQNDREAVQAIIQGVKTLETGLNLAIFPEGKRTYSDEMDEFRAGAFKLAMKPKVTILPVTINKGYEAERSLFNITRKSRCSITFHKPVRYEDYKDMDSQKLAEHVKSTIRSGIRG